MKNTMTEVPLRKRSTPYDFCVEFYSGSDKRTLYKGASANYAKAAYWQAVKLGIFLEANASVRIAVTRSRAPYGNFTTEVIAGKVNSTAFHIPSGRCVEWTTGSWTGDHLAEKLIATIPGMPGPVSSLN